MDNHYFIGLHVPSDLASPVEKIRNNYRLREAYKVIPHIEDLHVTLLFLGPVSETKLPELSGKFAIIAEDHFSFSLTVDGISNFGSNSSPSVIYLSIVDHPVLNSLQKDIATTVNNILSKPITDHFVPHITIAKKWKGFDNFYFKKEKWAPIEVSVPDFSLFCIHPNKVPKYEAVRTFTLK